MGESIALPLLNQVVHQFGVFALCVAVIWWALVARRGVSYYALWTTAMTFLIAGVLMLASSRSDLESGGAALVTAANTFSLAVLWYSSYDFARREGMPGYVVLGVVWVAHMLPREIARGIVWAAAPNEQFTVIVMAAMVVLIAGSIALILNDSVLKAVSVFDGGELSSCDTSVEPFCDDSPSIDAGNTHGIASVETSASPNEPSSERSADRAFERLRVRFALADREVEVGRYLAQGRSKASTAKRLYLSENTVRTHARNLYAKLDVHSRQDLLDLLECIGSE